MTGALQQDQTGDACGLVVVDTRNVRALMVVQCLVLFVLSRSLSSCGWPVLSNGALVVALVCAALAARPCIIDSSLHYFVRMRR